MQMLVDIDAGVDRTYGCSSWYQFRCSFCFQFQTTTGALTLEGGGGVTVTSTGGAMSLNGAGQTVTLAASTLDVNAEGITVDGTVAVTIDGTDDY